MSLSAFSSLRLRRVCVAAVVMFSTIFGAADLAIAAGDASPPAPANCLGTPGKTWLKVVVEDVHSAKGAIAITVYPDDASRFLIHHGSLFVERAPAAASTTSACIFLPKPAVYVIAIYHDENGNGSFDRSSLGLPLEGYGFSNNPPTLLGLPAFRSVRLDVARSGFTAHIHLTYP